MSGRIKTILLFALVLFASGQSAYAATYSVPGSPNQYQNLEAACIAFGNSVIGASGGAFTSVRFVSASISVVPALAEQGYYDCKLQYFSKQLNNWVNRTGTAIETKGCSAGDISGFKGPVSTAVFSDKYKKYFVVSPSAPSGCFEGCTFNSEGNKSSGCFLLPDSTTQGYCNYDLKNTGETCSGTTLSKADLTGDSLNPDPSDECKDNDCEVNPPDPGTDPGTEGPGTDPGTGEPGTDPGTGGPGTDPGTEGPGTDPGTGGPGTDPGTGGPGTDPGTGGPGTDPGTGGPGTDPGTGGPGPVNPGEPCKGDKFGESGCPEYKDAQALNSTNARVTDGVEQAQQAVGDALSKTQENGSKMLDDSERSIMQRFNSFLPTPSACVNPVVNILSWLSISIEICRYTFVKTLLTWIFSVSTFIYVFRVMTSLGSTSEV